MAYETKVLLVALGEIVSKAESVDEVYRALMKMANAEGVILEPPRKKEEQSEKE